MPVLNWRQLQYLNNQKQSGNVEEAPDAPWLEGWDRNADDAYDQYVQRFRQNVIGLGRSPEEKRAAIAEAQVENPAYPEYSEEDILNAGYGQSKFDYRTPFDQWIQDPVNARANAQTAIGQFANGAFKLIPYAASTFLDNITGLIGGLINVGVDAVNGDGFTPLQSFIDNPVSQAHQDLREWSDKNFPNYRTNEEIEDADQWWKHLNANFWGDTFLKNMGFTIGAAYSGRLFGKAMQALQGKTVNKAYKAAMAAAAGDGDAEAVFRGVLQGAPVKNPKKMYDAFSKIHKSYSRMNATSQLVGGLGGAVGESRTEALMAAKEFHDEQQMAAQSRYEQAKLALQQEMMSNPDFIGTEPVYDGYGNQVDERPVLNKYGRNEYIRRLRDLQSNYDKELSVIDNEADRVANTTFLLNMPLLTASNIVMFGRMMSGGFRSQAKAHLKGNINTGYKPAGNTLTDVGKGLFRATTEGVEELSQKVFSEGAKDIGERNMAAFHNGKYDKESIHGITDWLSGTLSMLDSASEVARQGQTWEEFAIGFLTGSLGAVTHRGLAGGIAGTFREGREDREEGQQLADALNKVVQDPKFKERWGDMVRHNTYERFKQQALEKKDQYMWHENDDKQLISDIMAFANAGKLQDLSDMVDSFDRVTLDDIADIKSSFIDETDDSFDQKTDEDLLNWLKKRVKTVKKEIKEYRDFYNTVDFLSAGTTDKDVLEELVFNRMMLKRFEDRYHDVLYDVLAEVMPSIEQAAQAVDASGNPTANAKTAQRIMAAKNGLKRLFGGQALDATAGAYNESASPENVIAYFMDDARQEEVMSYLHDIGTFAHNPELQQKVSDLQKLVRSRQQYYSKIFDPKNRQEFDKLYQQDAKTDDDVAEDLTVDANENRAASLYDQLRAATTAKEYAELYDSLVPVDEDPKVVKLLDEKIAKDTTLSGLRTMVSNVSGYTRTLADQVREQSGRAVGKDTVSYTAIQDAFKNVDFGAVLSDAADANDAKVRFSRALLDSLDGNKPAQKIARAIIQEKLGDLAQAEGLSEPEEPVESGSSAEKELQTHGIVPPANGETEASDYIPVGIVNPTDGDALYDTPEQIDALQQTIAERAGVADTFDEFASEMGAAGLFIPRTGDEFEKFVRDRFEALKAGQMTPEQFAQYFIPFDRRTGNNAPANPASVLMSRLSDIISSTLAADDPQLVDFANGEFGNYNDLLTDNEKLALVAQALQKIDELKARRGEIADSEEDDVDKSYLNTDPKDESDPRRVQAKKEFKDRDTRSIRGSVVSVYNTTELPNGIAIPFEASHPGTKATIDWFNKHHVQEFIDSGALAKLYQMYKDRGEDLKIHFIANPHLIKDNLDVNPFATPPSKNSKYPVSMDIVLAIEMSDENREALGKFEEQGVFSEDTLITIQEGDREVKYQPIGEVWNPTQKFVDGNPEYTPVKENANKIWDYAVARSILPHYQADVAKDASAFDREGRWYVAKIHPETKESDISSQDWNEGEPLYTTLNFVGSGRNMTRTITDRSYHKHPLSETMTEYNNLGGEHHFAMATHGRGVVTTQDAPEFPVSINAPAGSLWMATQTANGSWEWSYITIASTDEFNFNDENNPMALMMRDTLDKILAPYPQNATKEVHAKDFLRRAQACKDLRRLIYFGSGNDVTVHYDNGRVFANIAGMQVESVEQAISAIRAGRFRFQVDVNKLDNEPVMRNLINSGILQSEMRSFIRRGANIGINFLVDRDADDNLVDVHPAESTEESFYRTPGQRDDDVSAAFEVRDSVVSGNIRLGNNGYNINADGTVTTRGTAVSPGQQVEDPVTVAYVKAFAELLRLEQEGALDTFTGDSYVVSNDHEYMELYSKNIDGVEVHIVREGRNGSFKPAFSDRVWNDTLSYAKVMGTPRSGATQGEAPAVTEEERRELDEIQAAEQGGTNAERQTRKPGTHKTRADHLREVGQKTGSRKRTRTRQQIDIEQSKLEEEEDCG